MSSPEKRDDSELLYREEMNRRFRQVFRVLGIAGVLGSFALFLKGAVFEINHGFGTDSTTLLGSLFIASVSGAMFMSTIYKGDKN